MVMKHLKGSLLLLLIMMSCIFWGNRDVKAAEPDFFKEYSSEDSYMDEEYNFRLKHKCRLSNKINNSHMKEPSYSIISVIWGIV